MNRLFGIYAIIDSVSSPDPERDADAVLRGGVRLVQYRAKSGIDRWVVRRLHGLTAQHGALLIVNDDESAAEDADGLHVGQEDLALIAPGLRDRLGARVLGISCGTPSEAVAARGLGADYIGVGPFAQSGSKADAGPAIGAPGLAAVGAAARDIPVAAIGGIGLDELAAVAGAGARMAAVISALVADGDPEGAARRLVGRWKELAG